MNQKIHLTAIYILSVLSIFLPWFTYNPDVMGYCWGFQFLKWMILPLLIIGVFLFRIQSGKLLFFLAEMSIIAILAIFVMALGRWQEICNIIEGFQWKDGLHTALPTFWISAGLFLLFFILLQQAHFKKAVR